MLHLVYPSFEVELNGETPTFPCCVDNQQQEALLLLRRICTKHDIPWFSKEENVLSKYSQLNELCNNYGTTKAVFISNFILNIVHYYLIELSGDDSVIQTNDVITSISPKIKHRSIMSILSSLRSNVSLINDDSISLTALYTDEDVNQASKDNVNYFCHSLINKIMDCFKKSGINQIDILMVNSEDWPAIVVFCLTYFKRDSSNNMLTYLNLDDIIYVKFHMIFSERSSRDSCRTFITNQRLDYLVHVHSTSLGDLNKGIIDQFQGQLIGKLVCSK